MKPRMGLATLLKSGTYRLLARIRGVANPADRFARIERQCSEILDQLKALNDHLADATRRESQLRAVLMRDAELERHLPRLEDILRDERTSPHITEAVGRAGLQRYPFPYVVVDQVFPEELYAALIRSLPPLELFSDRPVNKQQLTVPFRLAPAYSRRVWRFVTAVVVPKFVMPAVVEKFRAPLDEWIAQNWPEISPASVALETSDGRILLRRRGYRIPPHRDPKWAFITGILYLARRGDSEAWGTHLYSVDGDEDARGASPHWIDPTRCRSVDEVAFRANRMLLFLNSVGAHGAHIPEDAQPEALERYIYQFRIGPTVASMAMLKASLSEQRRPFWAGKAADY
jgi:hypothetical protein